MANNRVIPTSLEPQLLQLRQAQGATLDELTAWLADQGITASRESVRRLLKRLGAPEVQAESADELEAPAAEPADPAEQIRELAGEVSREIKRARHATRSDPQQWRRLHSALLLKLRLAQAQQPPSDGQGQSSPWSPPTFGVIAEKG